jgi:DNA-binding NarL/FixJ family response regulator
MKQLPKVIIVDDHTLFREGIKLLVEQEGIGQVIAEAQNGNEFLKLLNSHNPDIVLMDIEMPQMNGLEATLKAKEIRPELKILVITMQNRKDNYIEMLNAGAMGFVLKTAGKYELLRAITSILAGEQYFCHEILQKVVADFIKKPSDSIQPASTNDEITSKELEVLKHLCKGLTVSEIAENINRSTKTVEAHRSKLLEKTNSKNTVNLILFAIKNGLVEV